MKRLVIHAGVHRTGTTALQAVFADNRALLRQGGVVYPFTGTNHQDIVWDLYHGKLTGADLRGRLLDAAGDDASTIVLSGEDFCVHEDLAWVAELRESFDVEVAFYLRRQDLWVASWYNQHVKWPFNREKSQASPREFLDTVWEYHWLEYAALLDRWRSAVELGRIHVALLDDSEPLDVVADFAGLIGVDPTGLKGHDRRDNDSMPVAALEIARHMGMIDRGPWARNLIGDALRAVCADRDETSDMVFSPTERIGILERFAETNQAVAQEYFGRDVLFRSPAPQPTDPYFAFPDLDREQLLTEWVAPFVSELINLFDQQSKRR